MRQVDTMPTEGQFVAVYSANNAIWSDTLSWCKGCVLIYSEEEDEFEKVEYDIIEHLNKHEAIFFTL